MQATASTSGLQPSNTEDPLHIHRLFIRSQLHPAIDYHTEIQQVIFLSHAFLFLYDNHLYLGRYYDHYQHPQLIVEQRIVSMCLINEAQGQVLVCYEAGGFYFLIFPPDTHTHMMTQSTPMLRNNNQQAESNYHQSNVQEERLHFNVDVNFELYYEQCIQNHSNQSPLQENYSIKLDYFSQHNIFIVAMHPLLCDQTQPQQGLQSQVVEVVVDEQAGLAGKCIKTIDSKYVHNQSIHTLWSMNDFDRDGKVLYVACASQDSVIYLFPLSYSVEEAVQEEVKATLVVEAEMAYPSSSSQQIASSQVESQESEEPNEDRQQRTSEPHRHIVEKTVSAKEKKNEEDEDEEEDDGEEDDDDEEDEDEEDEEAYADTVEPANKSKDANLPAAIPPHVKAGGILMRTKHKAWITALSTSMYSQGYHSPKDKRKGSCYTMSGDKLGGVALYLFHADTAPNKPPWKLCDFRHSITSQQAVSNIIIHYQSNQVIKAYLGDQAGRITIVNISEKTNKMHIVQEVALFSTFGSVTQISIQPIITTRTSIGDDDYRNDDQSSVRSSMCIEDSCRLRCYSQDAGEAVECRLSKQMASVMKVWPESILQPPNSRFYPHVSLDTSLYQVHSLIQTSFILSEYNVLFVSDFTKHMHVYDIISSCLLLSILMPSDHCTCLLAYPDIHDRSTADSAAGHGGKAVTLVSGHKDGHVHVYHVRFPPKKRPPTADEPNPSFMESIAMGSSKSSNYHLTHPTVYSEDVSNDMQDISVVKSVDDQTTTSYEESEYEEESIDNDNGVLDLLNNPEEAKDTDSLQSSLNPSLYPYDEDSQVLHTKHHHHHYQPRTPDVRTSSTPLATNTANDPFFEGIRYEVAQSMHPCPLQVTELFFSTHAQYLVSIHLKRYLHVFQNMHFIPPVDTANVTENIAVDVPSAEDKLSSSPTDKAQQLTNDDKEEEVDGKKRDKRKSSKAGSEVAAEKTKPPLSSKGKSVAVAAKDFKPVDISGKGGGAKKASTNTGNAKKVSIVEDNEAFKESKVDSAVIPKERYLLLRQMKFDEACQSITMLQCMDGILEHEEDLPQFDAERLILTLTPLVSNEMKILNAIECKLILSIPLPTVQVGKSFPGQEKYKNVVRSVLVWDYTLRDTKERPLIGLCNTTTPDQYIAFNESHGFQPLVDQDHQTLITDESHLRDFSMYHQTWQRDLMVGIQGYARNHSPIMVTWSNYHCILLRLQLHAERGPLIMRSKHYYTHNQTMYSSPGVSSRPANEAEHTSAAVSSPHTARIVTAKALKHVSYIRNHRVLVVLSTGYAIILHL